MTTPSTSGLASAMTSGKGLALIAFAVLSTLTLLVIGRSSTVPPTAKAPTVAIASTPNFSLDQEAAIGKIVKAYLLKNPQTLVEAGQALERQQREQQAAKAKQILSSKKNEIFKSPHDFVYGNPKGDITIVEYFDYNCGWCKRALNEVVKLTKEDPKVRVVMKEFPVFGGPPSVEAAKAALAAQKQGKYWDFHVALMRERRVTPANLYKVAKKVGLNVAKLKADMADPKLDTIIRTTVQTARSMGVEATPGFLIDSRLNVGYLGAPEMKNMLAEIRKKGCEIC